VAHSLREAALALGYPRCAPVNGGDPNHPAGHHDGAPRPHGRRETALLLFTALGSQYPSFNMNQPMAALPLTVFNYATGSYEECTLCPGGRTGTILCSC
jgi:phosphate transport system permease protein